MNGCQPSTMYSLVIKTTFFIVIHFKQYLGSLPPLPEPSLIKCKRAKGQPFLYNRASTFDIWLPTAFRSRCPPLSG